MTRTLQLTPAEVAAWADVPEGGTFWLVGDGVRQYVGLKPMPSRPPAEFVQACAPCPGVPPEDPTACGGAASFGLNDECVHCRIELVGSCPLCGGTGKWVDCDFACNDCEGTATMPLGWAYAVGQPLPIRWYGGDPDSEPVDDAILVRLHTDGYYYADLWAPDGYVATITADLAHCGPPESLVGKWALQVQVLA